MASRTISYRSSAGASESAGWWGGAAAGTNSTRSSASCSSASSAISRWPKWMGLNDPPKTAVRRTRSVPELTVALHDVLDRGQLLDTDGPAGMNARRRDSHLRAHAELPAVDEAGRGVDEAGRRVDLAREAARMRECVRHDGLGETRAVTADMLDGLVEIVHDADGQDQVQILLVPVALRRCHRAGHEGLGARAAAHLHARLGEPRGRRGEKPLGDGPVHQPGLQRVA